LRRKGIKREGPENSEKRISKSEEIWKEKWKEKENREDQHHGFRNVARGMTGPEIKKPSQREG
jgi:hypothetical protein